MTTQNKNLRIVFFAAICIVFILSIFSYKQIDSLIKSSALVNHTTHVTRGLEKVVSTIKDAETGHKGYIITHDQIFLETFEELLKEFPDNINVVRQLIAENPEQQKNLLLVELLGQRRQDYMRKMLEKDKLQTPTVAEFLFGKLIMDSLQTEVNTMIAREVTLMEQHTKKLNKQTMIAPAMVLILSLLNLLILIISYLLLNKSFIEAQRLKNDNLKFIIETEKQKDLQNIFKQFPISISIFRGNNFIVESINDICLEMWGKNRNEVINKSFIEIFPELGNISVSIFKKIIETGQGVTTNELKLEFIRNGKPYTGYYNFMHQPLKNINEKIDGVISIAIEVTESVNARNAIEENKRLLEAITQNTPDIVYVFDLKYRLTYLNEAFLKMLGRTLEDSIGKNFIEIGYEPWQAEMHEREIDQVIATKKTFRGEVPLTHATLGERIYDYILVPVINRKGKVEAIVGTTRDITPQTEERKQIEESEKRFRELSTSLEEKVKERTKDLEQINLTLETLNRELRVQKEFSDTILNTSPDLIGAYDPEMNIIIFNKACEDLFQIKKEDVIGKKFTDAFPQGKNKKEHKDLIRALNGEKIHNSFYQSGTTGRYYENFIIPLIDELGKVYAAVAIAHDITDMVQSTEIVKKANDELQEKNIELTQANKELESFNYVSSHDLQEPLRQIQNFASRINDIEQQNLSEKGKTYFEKMNNAANRMQTLITDLLAYSRINTSERKFEMSDLNKIIEDVIDELKETIDEKQATFEIAKLFDANVIPFQFRQMMYNLIGNSLKFAKHETPSHIIIKNKIIIGSNVPDLNLNSEKEYCHISIRDNGIGFEPQYKDRIFEIFQRLHDKQKIAGTGIGLAIVKKIVDNHYGVVTATGEPNIGATFDIYIPQVKFIKSQTK